MPLDGGKPKSSWDEHKETLICHKIRTEEPENPNGGALTNCVRRQETGPSG